MITDPRWTALGLAALSLVACDPNKPPPAPAPAASSTAAPAPVPEGAFAVEASDAKAKGLPAIGFMFMPPSGWSGTPFAEGHYATISSPPGGGEMVRVKKFEGSADASGLESYVMKSGAAIGEMETVTVGSASAPARSNTLTKGDQKMHLCTILVAGKGGAVILELQADNREKSLPKCADLAARPGYADIVKSFSLR